MKTFEDLVNLDLVNHGTLPIKQSGGQSCGVLERTVFIEIEALGLRVECRNKKSNLDNLKLCQKMIESILPELT